MCRCGTRNANQFDVASNRRRTPPLLNTAPRLRTVPSEVDETVSFHIGKTNLYAFTITDLRRPRPPVAMATTAFILPGC
jgi:hypothetical protein